MATYQHFCRECTMFYEYAATSLAKCRQQAARHARVTGHVVDVVPSTDHAIVVDTLGLNPELPFAQRPEE